MTSSTRRARHGRTLASGLALVALAASAAPLLPAAPASAVTLDAGMFSTVDFREISGGVCRETGVGSVQDGPRLLVPDGIPVTTSSSSSATYTDTGNPADITNLQARTTATGRATAVAGVLSELELNAAGTVDVQSAQGLAQECDAGVFAQSGFVMQFDLPTPRVLVVDVDASNLGAQLFFQPGSIGDAGPNVNTTLDISFGQHAESAKTMFLAAGHYTLGFSSLQSLSAPEQADDPARRSGTLSMRAAFHEPGVALTARDGGGEKYVELGGRSCADGVVPATFRAKAGSGKHRRIKKAIFYVDGTRVKTVRKPGKKRVVTLTHLDSRRDLTVEVQLKLFKKGAVTAERTYLRCI